MSEKKALYPSDFHFRIIAEGNLRREDGLDAVLSRYCVVSPLSQGNASRGGRYLSLACSVRMSSRKEHAAFDKELRAVEGVRVVL